MRCERSSASSAADGSVAGGARTRGFSELDEVRARVARVAKALGVKRLRMLVGSRARRSLKAPNSSLCARGRRLRGRLPKA